MKFQTVIRKILPAALLILPTLLLITILLHNPVMTDGGIVKDITVKLTDANGNTFTFVQEGSEQNAMIALLEELFLPTQSQPMNQQTLRDDPEVFYYTVHWKERGRTTIWYRLYFRPKDDSFELYFHDSLRMLNMRKAEQAVLERFLKTDYAASIFNEKLTPRMHLSSGEEVAPTELLWYYRFGNTSVNQGEIVPVAPPNETYATSGDIAFSLDPPPDDCEVLVARKNGEILFTGTIEEMAQRGLELTEPLEVSVRASWKPSDTHIYSGTASYRFCVQHIEPANFYVMHSSAFAGGFLAVTGENIASAERIQCTLVGADAVPVYYFYPLGQRAVGYVILPGDLVSGEHVLQIEYGNTQTDIVFFVRARSMVLATYENIDIKTYEDAMAYSVLQERLLMRKQTEIISDILFEHTAWQSPETQDGCTLVSAGGSRVSLTNALNINFTREGNTYSCPQGAEVRSCAGGVVLKTGYNAYDGHYAMIDHGAGLVSLYSNVSRVVVGEGQLVRSGDIVALAGKSGLSGTTGFILTVTLLGKPIYSDSLWSE